ncbi:MFS transporter [Devosia epidermidihirudinis]|uniref:MFS transporter n=1 Tax=Devosia epidermidihirudinis TaxID=1293439 RepID=UPI000697BC3B|nr:MFS transporter [Devosia epidermidihirudinis]
MSVEIQSQNAWWERASRALRHPNYQRYFMAQVPLLVGTWIHSIALGWLMWRLSGSPWMLGVLAVCDLGPTFLLSPFVGTVIDRTDLRKLLIAIQAGFVLLVGILIVATLTDTITIPLLIGITLGIGILAAFDNPARQVFVAELVGPDDLRNAIALNTMLFNLARLIGPAIGGAVVATAGEGWCFVLKAIAYLPMLFVLIRMRPPQRIALERQSFFKEMLEGFAFVRHHPEMGRLLILVATCSFCSVPYFYFLPALVRDMLGQDADAAGLLMSLTGLGAILAAIMLTVRDRLDQLRVFPAWSALALGLVLIGMGFSGTYWITALLALPLGFSILSQNLSSNTMLQHFAPSGLRGRIMAMYSMMLLGTVPLGSLLAGALGASFGMPVTFIAGGALCSAVGIALALTHGKAPPVSA